MEAKYSMIVLKVSLKCHTQIHNHQSNLKALDINYSYRSENAWQNNNPQWANAAIELISNRIKIAYRRHEIHYGYYL